MAYPHLDNFIGACLNQDYAYFGDTVEGVIDAYRGMLDRAGADKLQSDARRFVSEHPDDLEQAFHDAYWYDFDPKLWDMTALQFLQLLDRRMQR